MILNKVKIRNYRQYRNVDIDFAKDDNKNFTIIKGNNGTGKTTLLNSLSWCLYGSEIHDYGDDAAMSICNNKTANLALVGDEIEVSVELEFIDDGNLLAFHRVQGYDKTKDGLRRQPSLDKFEIKTQDGNDIGISTNVYYTLERKIPREIEDYFFFDGARLSEYFQATKNKQIRNAVYSLSQLNLIENTTTNLEKVKSTYINKQRNISPKIGGANEKINEYNKFIRKSEESLNQAEKDIEEIRKEIDDIDEELINRKSLDVQKDAQRNKELDRKIKGHGEKLDKIEANLKKHVLTKYPYVLSYEAFVKFLDLGEESREKGYIPPKFKKSFIRDLLESGKCICGTDLNVDLEHRKVLEQLLEETNPLTDNSEELTVALNQVKEVIMKDIESFRSKSIAYHRDIKDLRNEREDFIEEKRHIEARLKANPLKEIEKLINRRRTLNNTKNNLESKIANLKSSIERNRRLLGEQEKLLNQEKRLEKELKEYQRKIDFCNNAIVAASNIYHALKEEMREKVEALTKEKFIKISWKEEEFVDIIIDEDYDVYIENRLGELERPGDLSDGEKLCLGLCFMSALHNISGFDLPIIMDTPLGNLDVDMRHNIAEFLPKFVGDKQTVLLVTGTEYTDDFRDTLFRAVGKEYEIEWDNSDEGKESKVVLNG